MLETLSYPPTEPQSAVFREKSDSFHYSDSLFPESDLTYFPFFNARYENRNNEINSFVI